jgi:mRNA interferase MazF
MINEGHVSLIRFPLTDGNIEKFRPVLLLKKLPGNYDDWLVCMISSKTQQFIIDFDETIYENDSDFELSGLKKDSIIRISRLAVVEGSVLIGRIGSISNARLSKIYDRITTWIKS